jgi:hypothetical protein
MTNDTICPRCDQPLDAAPEPEPENGGALHNGDRSTWPTTALEPEADEDDTPPNGAPLLPEASADADDEDDWPAAWADGEPEPPDESGDEPDGPEFIYEAEIAAVDDEADEPEFIYEAEIAAVEDQAVDPAADGLSIPPDDLRPEEPGDSSPDDSTPAEVVTEVQRLPAPPPELALPEAPVFLSLPEPDTEGEDYAGLFPAVITHVETPGEEPESAPVQAEDAPEPVIETQPHLEDALPPETAQTVAHLEDELIQGEETLPHLEDTLGPAVAHSRRADEAAEDVPARYRSEAGPGAPPADEIRIQSEIQPTPSRQVRAPYVIPPAPYTPPPDAAPPPPATLAPPRPATLPPAAAFGYGVAPGAAFLQQRVHAYRQSGYRLHAQSPYEATLSRGKALGALGWLVALLSIIGALWYGLILTASGFRRDRVYITLEQDGRVYEDGPGAAHVRRQRSRAGRRWSIFGAVIFVLALILAVILLVVAWIGRERYRPELRAAYPEITLFEDEFDSTPADPDAVALVEDGVVAFSIVAGITLLGLVGGLLLLIIGFVHARAYRVRVPVPGYE